MLKNILILLLISNSVFAQNAVPLNQDDPAPFTGVLVTSGKLVELDKAARKSIVLKDLSLTQEELIKYHKASAKDYRERLSDAKFDSFISNTGYLILGVLLASFAFKVSGKVGDI